METADYYHEVAPRARRIADEFIEDARRAMDNGSREASRAVENAIKQRVEREARFATFEDLLGDAWTLWAFGPEEAAAMGEIIEASYGRFPDTVSGTPENVLKEAAAETIENDMRRGATQMIRARLVESGHLDRR